jgi:hypothetical protein
MGEKKMRKTLIIAAVMAAVAGPSMADDAWHKIPCRSVMADSHGTDIPAGAGDALAESVLANKFGSICNMYSFVAAECRQRPSSSVGAAVSALLRKAASGRQLPDIPMCGV